MSNELDTKNYLTTEEACTFVAYANNIITTLVKNMNAFMTISNERNKSIENMLSVQTNNQKIFFEKLLHAMSNTDAPASTLPLPAAEVKQIAQDDPLIVNTLGEREVKDWTMKSMRRVEALAPKMNKKHGKDVLRSIYKVMNANGIDTDKGKSLYMKKHGLDNISKIKVCANSDIFRHEFDRQISLLELQYCGADKNLSKSLLVKRCPDSVRNIVNRIPGDKGFTAKCYLAFARLEKELGKSLNSEMIEYAKKLGVSVCSKSYYIGCNKNLLEKLSNVVDEINKGE